MSAYPPDFWDWPEAKRNAFFKAAADAFEVQEKAKATGDGVAGQPKTRGNSSTAFTANGEAPKRGEGALPKKAEKDRIGPEHGEIHCAVALQIAPAGMKANDMMCIEQNHARTRIAAKRRGVMQKFRPSSDPGHDCAWLQSLDIIYLLKNSLNFSWIISPTIHRGISDDINQVACGKIGRCRED